MRVVGMQSICEEFSKVGIETVGGENELIDDSVTFENFLTQEVDPEVQAVVVGLDTKFNYLKLALASLYI